MRDPRPVVIRGTRLDVVGTWTVDWFLEHFGNVPVYFALMDSHVKEPLDFFRRYPVEKQIWGEHLSRVSESVKSPRDSG